jgi:hypothetical protein
MFAERIGKKRPPNSGVSGSSGAPRSGRGTSQVRALSRSAVVASFKAFDRPKTGLGEEHAQIGYRNAGAHTAFGQPELHFPPDGLEELHKSGPVARRSFVYAGRHIPLPFCFPWVAEELRYVQIYLFAGINDS